MDCTLVATSRTAYGDTMPEIAVGTKKSVPDASSDAGTILTSFYMVLWFEVNQILIGMIVVSFVCGLAAQPFRDAR